MVLTPLGSGACANEIVRMLAEHLIAGLMAQQRSVGWNVASATGKCFSEQSGI